MIIARRFTLFIFFLLTIALDSKANDTLNIENYLFSKHIKAEKTREGIFYTIYTEGVGVMPKDGDYVKIRYTGKLLDGKTFDESPINDPFIFQVGFQQVIQGWDIVIPKLKVGTKATIYVPAKYGYGTTGMGNVIPANSPLVYDLEIESVLSKESYNTHMRDLEDRERKAFYKKMDDEFLQDKVKINEYAIAHKLKVQRTESGLSYLITKEGKGERAKEGNLLIVSFQGYLLNDKLFESNNNKPFTFKLGDGRVIEGWEEGLKLFNKGSEGYLLIPSKMAFGSISYEEGKIPVPPHSNLVYKIQVIDIQ